ncbi:MAG: GntR family transcriptional regulator [Coriobacteriaceae bacterium]|jgi:GntR family transcriptional regulator|nr:GntR family transcriptional regulator [Coriobacteriaceae bacterium]
MFSFRVDTASDLPLWVQLRNRLIYLINTGHYKPGDQLPTVRGLASAISINYNTVNKAYLSLMSDGYIESTRGRGAFVRDLEEAGEENNQAIDALFEDCIDACLEMGMTFDDISKYMTKKLRKMEKEQH